MTSAASSPAAPPTQISGRYPHLAMVNSYQECGTGAVVPWAGKLWVITYAPHEPGGSDDKLYEIDGDLNRTVRPESIGGTPADRMIHTESKQLIIGPYVIDAAGRVRVVPISVMPGRLTAVARHLTDPANKVYVYDMEGMLYELDVHTLAVTKLAQRAAPGAHGKGAYTAQGRLVVANNGNDIVNNAAPAAQDPAMEKEADVTGALAEWDGGKWTLLARRQFTDVTGPGGIEGSPTADSALWALGWDKRSVIVKLLDRGTWSQFRLPIADDSYVAKHGWFTEWPRIRDIGNGNTLLMNMHGGWFDFPKTFDAAHTAGIRPVADYLKITADFANFNGRLVFGCDDASLLGNPWLGQSQSNLWFTTRADLSKAGNPSGAGGPLVDDSVTANTPSDPFLLAGYDQARTVHLWHDHESAVTFTFEVDAKGDGHWAEAMRILVPPHQYVWRTLPAEVKGEWVRVKTDADCTRASAFFIYGPGGGATTDPALLAGLADAGPPAAGPPTAAGKPIELSPLAGDNALLITRPDGSRQQISADLAVMSFTGDVPLLTPGESASSATPKKIVFSGAVYRLTADPSSLVLTVGTKRYRLPVAVDALNTPDAIAAGRPLRELVTERYLLNAGGSFFMVPQVSAGGPMRMKPIATHGKAIADFCSWRGLTAFVGPTGRPDASGHAFDLGQNTTLWLGDVDDLWRTGKPRGHGGPWLKTDVAANTPSDPYLMDGYDHKTLTLTNHGTAPVKFTAEVDVRADGQWQTLPDLAVLPAVAPGQSVTFPFPHGYSAHWIRFRTDAASTVSAQLAYD